MGNTPGNCGCVSTKNESGDLFYSENEVLKNQGRQISFFNNFIGNSMGSLSSNQQIILVRNDTPPAYATFQEKTFCIQSTAEAPPPND